MKKLLFTLFTVLCVVGVSIAQRTISGMISDAEGLALIGANVSVPNTTIGTITDIDGKFSLVVPEGSNEIEVSYIGFDTQVIDISNESSVNITLAAGGLLEEVVVIGYGEQNKASITGSVTSISAEKLEARPFASIDQMLQGQAPGLTVLSGSGQPGSNDVSVYLRGPSSITGSNAPIYILDGMQISGEDFGSLNSNDIESVSILKDASSTAIYGASAANGVILITTKKGKDGKTSIKYSGQMGFTSLARENFNMMNSSEKLLFEERAGRGPGWTLSPINPANEGLSAEDLASNESELNRLKGINTDWRDIVFRSGKTQQHNISATGGDDNTDFFISANYYGEEGVLNGSDFDRGTVRTNWSEQFTDRVKVGIATTGGLTKSRFVSSENAINLNNPAALAYLTNPYDEVRDEDGEFAFGSTGRNPVEESFYNYSQENTIKGIGQIFTEIEPVDHFTFIGRYGVDYTNTNIKGFTDPESRLGSTSSQGQQGRLSKNVNNTTWLTLSNTLNYNNQFSERHNVDVLIGQERRQRSFESYGFSVYGLSGGLEVADGGTTGSEENPDFISAPTGTVRKKILNSYFSRVNYTLDDKYNLTAGFRRDGSSVFGSNNQYGNFWNVGASWIISRESFLKGNDVLNFLKVGLSYGTNGNSEGIGEREAQTLYTTGDYLGSAALIPSSTNPGNPDLKWEELKGYNATIDFGLWNDRVTGGLAYYKNTTESLFITQNPSLITGVTSLSINAGTMQNAGYEFELAADLVRTKDAYVNWGVQFAYNNNEITDLGQENEFETGTSIIRVGLPLGSHYVEEWGGVDPATGNPLYIDDNGNYTDNYSDVDPKAAFGTFYAPYTGSTSLEVGFKGFTVSALGAWVYGNALFNNQTFFQENPNFAQFNMSAELNDVWLEPGDITNVQKINSARNFSSKDIEDGSFFRLRNVTVGYDIPTNNRALGGFDRLNVFVQAKNLLTITNFSGFDPEDSNNIASYGFPASRTLTFGVNANF